MTRLYIADDQLLLREGLHALLTSAGHTVVGEGSEPAVIVADAERAGAEIVLLDLSLGRHSGFEVMEEFKHRGSTLRVIVVTMSAQPRHVAGAIRLGAFGYVLKDSGADELLRAVHAVAGGRRFFGPQVADLALQALADEPQADPFSTLSPRERQIATMVVNGMSSAVIGAELQLSPKTVDTYRSRVMTKLGVSGVTALVRLAVREGLIED